jgi:hypothetical protein
MKKIIIIGAGASGVMCSIYLKKLVDCEVIILEANASPLKKLLATGNGRCNLSNKDMTINHYEGKNIKIIENILNYDIEDEFFKLGLLTKYQGNLLYPRSEQAKTVYNTLYDTALSLGVQFIFNSEVIQMNEHTIYTQNQKYHFDICVFAFGSPAGKLSLKTFDRYHLFQSLGLKVNELRPSIVQMKTKPAYPSLKGVKIKGTFSLYDKQQLIKKEKGELLFTDDGVSGIAIMNLSRYVNKSLRLEIDMFDDYNEKELYKLIVFRQKEGYNHFYDGLVNTKLSHFLEKKGLTNPRDIVNMLKHFELNVISLRDETYAQVMKGGLSLEEVNSSLNLKKYPQMYAIGECLDVAGDCGGYNLHFAFASSYKVAKEIERKYYAEDF